MNKDAKAVILATLSTGAALVIVSLVLKVSTNPDVLKTLKMKGALSVKRIAYAQVDFWSGVGAWGSTAYQKAKL